MTDPDRPVGEVDRLRGLLARLEWVEGIQDTSPCCAVCYRFKFQGHDPDCWLAAELRTEHP